MAVIATAADTRFEVSRVDIDRAGPTYTVDTLRDLQAEYARHHPADPAQWFFITGADALAEIVGWHDPDGIIERAHLVGVTRPGHNLADPGLPDGVVTLIEIPALAISSSDIRARVAEGKPIDYLLPEGVARWVRKKRLYLGDRA